MKHPEQCYPGLLISLSRSLFLQAVLLYLLSFLYYFKCEIIKSFAIQLQMDIISSCILKKNILEVKCYIHMACLVQLVYMNTRLYYRENLRCFSFVYNRDAQQFITFNIRTDIQLDCQSKCYASRKGWYNKIIHSIDNRKMTA